MITLFKVDYFHRTYQAVLMRGTQQVVRFVAVWIVIAVGRSNQGV